MKKEKTIQQSADGPRLLQAAVVITGSRAQITDSRIALSMRLLEKEYECPNLKSRDLAKLFRLSESRFRHLFLQEVGISPSKFLKLVRLKNARILLETSLLAVKEVMLKVGYRDPSHFNRDYRAAYHLPPSRHMRQFLTAAAG